MYLVGRGLARVSSVSCWVTGWQGFLMYLVGRGLVRVSSVSCWARAGKGF